MKTTVSLSLLLVLASAAQAQFLYTFNEPGELQDNFNFFNTQDDPDTVNLQQSASGGLNGSGSVSVSTASGVGALGSRVEIHSFPGSLASFTISAYFLHWAPTSTAGNPFALGFGPSSTYVPNWQDTDGDPGSADHNHLLFGLNQTGTLGDYRLRLQNKVGGSIEDGGGLNEFTSTFNLTDQNWYYFSVDITQDANGYSAVVELRNSDSSGVVGSLVATISEADMLNPALANDPAVHAFFGAGASARQRGVRFIDNFLSPIPEPTSAALLGAASLLFLLRRRR